MNLAEINVKCTTFITNQLEYMYSLLNMGSFKVEDLDCLQAH